MAPRRRRSSPWPLLAASLALLLLPSGITQKARLTALAGLGPFHALAGLTARAPGCVLPAGDGGSLRVQVEYLQAELEKARNELAVCQRQLEAASGLKTLVQERGYRLIPADVVVPTDGSPWRKSLTLAVGSRGGAEKGMLAVYNGHLVGRVVETAPWTSRVQAATDPGFRAGAVAAPRSCAAGVPLDLRHTGVFEGTAGSHGLLKWLLGDTPVEKDALVVTTEDPLNGVPRGLILGRVWRSSAGRGAFPRAEVDPILQVRALEHVALLAPPEGRR
jgi:cell shape-determining protein MreC